MINQLIDLQQLICILDESEIIQTKRYDINTLIHLIQHADFGFAAIIEEAIGGGTLLYEQSGQSINTLKPDNASTPVTLALKPAEITKYFHRRCKSGPASRGG
ncbi:hypothetical protein [Methylobacter psychrophilus]|uniref:hypothetical protein n=1 Tax=Methylobacter psychrophilus TaxID=96941 RepID=UPI0021D4E0EF|nr:hypothetical protein [Methylobacter psychrophilus]